MLSSHKTALLLLVFLLLILPDEIILFAASVGCFNLGIGFFAFLMM